MPNRIKCLWSKLLLEEKIKGGLADNKTIEDIAKYHSEKTNKSVDELLKTLKSELAKGIKVELEHTEDEKIAREIAMDHLLEDPKYYTKLATIENH